MYYEKLGPFFIEISENLALIALRDPSVTICVI